MLKLNFLTRLDAVCSSSRAIVHDYEVVAVGAGLLMEQADGVTDLVDGRADATVSTEVDRLSTALHTHESTSTRLRPSAATKRSRLPLVAPITKRSDVRSCQCWIAWATRASRARPLFSTGTTP